MIVLVFGSATQPRPGLHGAAAGVALSMVGLTVGALGMVVPRVVPVVVQAPFFAVLVISSAALSWLQPQGPGFLGDFLAMATAATRLRGRAGAIAAAAALVSLGVAAVRAENPVMWFAVTGLGAVAVYVLGVFADQRREGQELAERLVDDLEQSRSAQARAAALAERHRLAREMHDVLAHSLAGLVLQLEGARLLTARTVPDPRLAEAIENAHHLAVAGLQEARRAIGALRDEQLPGPDQLRALVTQFEQDCGVPCRLSVEGPRQDLAAEARLTVFRAAQEALTNIRKYADPHRVEVRLAYEPNGIRLTVEDFGPGPVAASPGKHEGFGLTGMRERAELVDGTLRAGPTTAGFRVELWVPA